MATPGQLRETVAAALDLPQATVTSFDRLLSEEGLRSKRGRGRGSAHVTARDAARLLTAILASGQVKDAVQSVRRYEASVLQRSTGANGRFEAFDIEPFAALPKGHSFVDALEALLVWASSGSVIARARDTASLVETPPAIEVLAATPLTIGDIRIAGIGEQILAARYGDADPAVGPSLVAKSRGRRTASRIVPSARRSDLEQYRKVSGRTVFHIAEVLNHG